MFIFFYFSVLQYQEQRRKEKDLGKSRAAPHCRSCGHPMKGHKNVKDCPLNKGEVGGGHQFHSVQYTAQICQICNTCFTLLSSWTLNSTDIRQRENKTGHIWAHWSLTE